jgi:hypothetical protein
MAQQVLPAQAQIPWSEALVHWQRVAQEQVGACANPVSELRPGEVRLVLQHQGSDGDETVQRYEVKEVTPMFEASEDLRVCLSRLSGSTINVRTAEELAFEAPALLTEHATLFVPVAPTG